MLLAVSPWSPWRADFDTLNQSSPCRRYPCRRLVLYSVLEGGPRLPCRQSLRSDSNREVAMESLNPAPIMYLLIVWGLVTAVFIVLLIRKSLRESHEDDQIFLDAAEEHMAREQRKIDARITAIPPSIHTRGNAVDAEP